MRVEALICKQPANRVGQQGVWGEVSRMLANAIHSFVIPRARMSLGPVREVGSL
jgi:hypothetical protein